MYVLTEWINTIVDFISVYAESLQAGSVGMSPTGLGVIIVVIIVTTLIIKNID